MMRDTLRLQRLAGDVGVFAWLIRTGRLTCGWDVPDRFGFLARWEGWKPRGPGIVSLTQQAMKACALGMTAAEFDNVVVFVRQSNFSLEQVLDAVLDGRIPASAGVLVVGKSQKLKRRNHGPAAWLHNRNQKRRR